MLLGMSGAPDKDEMLKLIDDACRDFVVGLFRRYIDGLFDEQAGRLKKGEALDHFHKGMEMVLAAKADVVDFIDSNR